MYAIKIISLSNGMETPFDGKYVKEYDPERDGVDSQGHVMNCYLVATTNLAEAMLFNDFEAARQCWVSIPKREPLRWDGEPNRPMTAFTIEIAPVD